jgi:peptide/nickel transport system permease protein
MTMNAIVARDYPVIMAVSLVSAIVVLLGNLLTDILYVVADPSIQYQ